MLLQGTISGEKTQKLVENYAKLLNSGVDSSKILVILQNSSRKNKFIEQTLEKLTVDVVEKLQVYSFFGLVYNTISDNWAQIENKIPDDKHTKILPNLTGLEISQFIMRDVISDIKFEGYNSKKSLLHQLFRRYSLIVQNNLSDEEVFWRSNDVLKESFAPDAKIALDEFKKKTLEARALDYLRQSLIFNYIYQKTDYFSKIEYLIVDDGDEITPICFDFIKHLAPQLKDVFIAYDPEGSSRQGYLSADKSAGAKFEALFEGKTLNESSNTSLAIKPALFTYSKRAQMLDVGIEEIKKLIQNGVKPSEISIVTPIIDDMLKFCLKESLGNIANLVFLSGSEKIIQNPIVHASITILKLCDTDLKNDVDVFDVRAILNFLQIPLKHCREILENFEKDKKFIDFSFKIEEYREKYKKFTQLLQKLPQYDKLSRQVFEVYENLVDIENYSGDEITKFNFFINQIEDFENVFGESVAKEQIINQIENSIISENPYQSLEINPNDLPVSTPQKIIDNQVLTKFQFWFDVSSDDWIKNDTGPLYNAWVFQADWDKPDYTLQDNIELSRQKIERILRKLTLCASEKVWAYASLFDSSGVENFGGIEKYLQTGGVNKIVIQSRTFTPRDDQKPVLDYKKGKMAISAVPGAGKTTILLELVIKLLKDGVAPENIFVLTYMESAARNFRERIQSTNQELSQLPNISTIHGLALKILKENDNFEKIGLNPDFEICDDTQRSRILQGIGGKLNIKKGELDDFDRAVSILKMGGECGGKYNSKPITDKKLNKFLEFFSEYKQVLQENNLIDYDDMLLFSVKLLEDNSDILKYYQEICHYVIEDEAQDSSAIQQKLIELLSGKHKNLIRCGDVNQAITTTFSNADVEGFRKFIETSETSITMDRAQRCSDDVRNLANKLIDYAQEKPQSKNAFYKTFIRPVEGKNPKEQNAITTLMLENEFVEKNYILKQVKKLLEKNPKATFGILLRNNFQVKSWTSFVSNSGLKTITRSECLEQKAIFRTIFSIMKIILNPFDNQNVADNYDILAELGHCKTNLYQLIKDSPKPFVEMNVDEMNNADLESFYWDVIYWLSFSSLSAEELAIKIGLHYYSSDIEKSNVYLVSTLIKRLKNSYPKYQDLIARLQELSKKPSLSGFKFFSEEEKSDREILEGKVQVMTLHKSKGDEFDYVFLPEMAEKNLPLAFEDVSLKKDARFMEEVRELNPKYKNKTDDELREFLLAENLRLMYVAITRAKHKLFISVSKNSKTSTVFKPCEIFKLGGKCYE